ncbi:hypothetical protein K443DRAFT_676122 [Laccaria amethystina LaAM-08-1]|uniref:Uncharacterized protein n=1 Tax=Laccaria amethystina LaAM-08-1 TaxID=1095629 RepID=A0A0C9XGT9_9AGAR|nr:hypothetical protein K443DRAFT_676122 [Laccaria amethystina LaAM-08-1]
MSLNEPLLDIVEYFQNSLPTSYESSQGHHGHGSEHSGNGIPASGVFSIGSRTCSLINRALAGLQSACPHGAPRLSYPSVVDIVVIIPSTTAGQKLVAKQ